MLTSIVVAGPDVRHGPLALMTGPFEQKVRRAAMMGFDGVELMIRDPSSIDWNALRELIQRSGIAIPQIVTGELFGQDGLCLVTEDAALHERSVERTKSVIDLAEFLGAMVNLGRLRGQLGFLADCDNKWAKALDLLRPAILYAAERKVRVTIEPINRYESDYVITTEDGCRLLDDLGCENAGLMLDLFHMNIEDPSIEDSLRMAGQRLWHIHIADSNRRYPGSGHLDFDAIFTTLDELGYKGFMSAEILPLPDPDTAADRTRDFFARVRR
jgi:sugar phosphate isomerase/epimerase